MPSEQAKLLRIRFKCRGGEPGLQMFYKEYSNQLWNVEGLRAQFWSATPSHSANLLFNSNSSLSRFQRSSIFEQLRVDPFHLEFNANPPKLCAPRFERPIFILAAPRSGSTYLYELLEKAPEVWSLGRESYREFAGLHHLLNSPDKIITPLYTPDAFTEEAVEALKIGFLCSARRRKPVSYADLPTHSRPQSIRFLEKLPQNSVRVEFLAKAFPDAQFVYLHRDPRENIGSIIDAWNSGRFISFPRLPGWSKPWSLILLPGWEKLNEHPTEEVMTAQWVVPNESILRVLEKLPRNRRISVSYQELIANPERTVQKICNFAQISTDETMLAFSRLRHASSATLTPPAPDKWRKSETTIEKFSPLFEPTAKRIAAFHNSQ